MAYDSVATFKKKEWKQKLDGLKLYTVVLLCTSTMCACGHRPELAVTWQS